MTYDDFTFPMDRGTGLEDTVDWNDAGAFAHLAHHPNSTDYIVDGFEFSVDFEDLLLNISAGVAEVSMSATKTNDTSNEEGGQEDKELIGATFKVQRDGSSSLNLDDGVNHVYLSIELTENNTSEFYVNTSGTSPPSPYLLLGIIDTEEESVVRPNVAPSATFRRMLITEDRDE